MTQVYPPYDNIDSATAAAAQDLLKRSGMAHADRDQHTRMTPYRLAHYVAYWFRPYDPPRFTVFENTIPKVDQLIVVAPIYFWACCSHHMLPFFGKVYFGYIPDKKLVGLSMVPLFIKEICARPWVQETMTTQLADLITDKLHPVGLGIVTKAIHTCQFMDLGGPPAPSMIYSDLRGALREKDRARAEFFKLIEEG